MTIGNITRTFAITGVAALLVGALAACGGSDPFADGASQEGNAADALVVGSANFAESEILANIYAQALNDNGIEASVKANIGSRDVYLAALEDGSIDMVPEYTGNLLQYYDADSAAVTADEVYEELPAALPDGMTVLDKAEAQDSDSFAVTRETSEANGITSIGDLAKLGDDLEVAAPPEFSTRPYGIEGLRTKYRLGVTLVPINDGGGQNTAKALADGEVQFARFDSTSPLIAENDFVLLDDPEHMIVAQNVVPLAASDALDDEAKAVINAVQAALTTEDLQEMNASSTLDKESAADIAKAWLADKQLF
ncbi:glycine/betaine ABC transporter [Bifidobacterium lemurum]|uniref:Glycine/betaine ABC transporter n=1 Tax=Bifidobacterium lemurum TaxID=1603886 RepID=A0A261FM84_9BIFI|nr:ABC transporter substrate-binding protein [Bifidobacterium lemurum]OZG60281.1 glycine/betaine ABC transporter [Bifidobacterium lemurum]QOL34165.1 ABC transporter substrate-binding protein [Bifidobacterium lemurum]